MKVMAKGERPSSSFVVDADAANEAFAAATATALAVVAAEIWAYKVRTLPIKLLLLVSMWAASPAPHGGKRSWARTDDSVLVGSACTTRRLLYKMLVGSGQTVDVAIAATAATCVLVRDIKLPSRDWKSASG
jgi:hypothetical protein